MKARTLLLTAMICASITAQSFAGAGLSTNLLAYPGYSAQWRNGEGLPSTKGNTPGLALAKVDPTASSGYAGAHISGVTGMSLTELGFAHRNDGACGDALFYRVIDPAGARHEFTCGTGIATPIVDANGLPTGWSTIRFPLPTPIAVQRIYVLLAFPAGSAGSTVVDDLDINGTIIGKTGNN
jgi:hypothetical protein